MNDREKVLEVLGLRDWEIFTCMVCGRRFYMSRVENETEHDKTWRGNILIRARESRKEDHICGECHSGHIFYPGETFLS